MKGRRHYRTYNAIVHTNRLHMNPMTLAYAVMQRCKMDQMTAACNTAHQTSIDEILTAFPNATQLALVAS
jgi:hypothetical protein